jgi:hypothetical protein
VADLARRAADEGISVRELERRVREVLQPVPAPATPQPARASNAGGPVEDVAPSTDPAVRRVENELRRYLQTDVHVQLAGEAKGSLRIAFYSTDDLDRLLDLILRERREAY